MCRKLLKKKTHQNQRKSPHHTTLSAMAQLDQDLCWKKEKQKRNHGRERDERERERCLQMSSNQTHLIDLNDTIHSFTNTKPKILGEEKQDVPTNTLLCCYKGKKFPSSSSSSSSITPHLCSLFQNNNQCFIYS